MRIMVCAVVLLTSVLSAGTAVGVERPVASPRSAGLADDLKLLDPADLVLKIAQTHPYEMVRTYAWVALLGKPQDQSIAEFRAHGYYEAMELAKQNDAQNMDFAKRIRDTTSPEFSPEVNAAAVRVIAGSQSDRQQFVDSGYAAALARDKAAREESGKQEEALREADRKFIEVLAKNDPGKQVRLRAQWAIREGAGNGALVEFFAYGWASAARIDLEGFLLRAADNEARWRASIRRLFVDAQEAEQAANKAAEEFREQARQNAARAWRTAADQATPARTEWQGAEDAARTQAETWRRVAAAAEGAAGPNWAAILAPAHDNEQRWATERQAADSQVANWTALWELAQAGEQRMTK
ncbi:MULTISPECIES: hypothetical protein [Amycolatopsis]|uniref:Uncharacterized protein n=1 Tax=Amycolatopsis dendrobii TaxID=2760662 RepID=A0A7W3W2P9_9PSEU|nr:MULTISPECIES: hypothetical protein [Amycolatopsis]MBB1157685.1 hypothetical protein [Amycolatopsis dendrobii]UKD54130.1 hypothetical protein L3Q65_40675 [Amycolatopsis sp. FU40]